METFSALLVRCEGNSPVTGEFPSQRPVARSFDVFFHLRLNRRLNKQSWGGWFETPSPIRTQFWYIYSICSQCWIMSLSLLQRSYVFLVHYSDAIMMSAMSTQITSLTIVYSTIHSGVDQKKTSKLRVIGLCEGYGEFPAQRASNAENVSIFWRHHD